MKVEVLTQLLYSSKSNKGHILKCTESIKVKRIISSCHFCAKLTEPPVINIVYINITQRLLNLKAEPLRFVQAVPKYTRK